MPCTRRERLMKNFLWFLAFQFDQMVCNLLACTCTLGHNHLIHWFVLSSSAFLLFFMSKLIYVYSLCGLGKLSLILARARTWSHLLSIFGRTPVHASKQDRTSNLSLAEEAPYQPDYQVVVIYFCFVSCYWGLVYVTWGCISRVSPHAMCSACS